MPKSPTPRVIFIRHGQTEWSKSGQYTSRTDLHLTEYGVNQARALGKFVTGTGNSSLLNVSNVKLIISSPRYRAIQTKELVFETIDKKIMDDIPFEIDEDVREWEYGDYEGLLTKEIIQLRRERNIPDKLDITTGKPIPWNIWADGCENGEDYTRVSIRLNRLIEKIRTLHKQALEKDEPCDVVVFGHGHILRSFAALWLGRSLNINPQFLLDTGAVGVLSYQHHNIDEPAIHLSPFVVPMGEETEHAA
ncbi:sedoheptulose-bisphosphatase [Saccharomycopsis crataegensis]|uniref:Sedoheptulose-bisphosphatase n=1 Tax=Saccharomycopsis crataegensis TaxID=43959 RepID=A0AAV5QK36_9ASCO|nr:sedoheptulose-bisphosphatase [Saccharomycopsis crataegensis]